MRTNLFFVIFFAFAVSSCKEFISIEIFPPTEGQIIADHKIVDDFDKIPLHYINEVKRMMVYFPGESHSQAYKDGMKLLQSKYPDYACNISTAEDFTEEYLRVNSGSNVGEAQWFTWYSYPLEQRPTSGNSIKDLITEYNNNGQPINVIGFAWCYDDVGHSRKNLWQDIVKRQVSIKRDPVYGVRWLGFSKGGPDGDRVWGLDAADYNLTGNRVSMDTYLKATEEYNTYCKENGIITEVVFTTGPADRYIDILNYFFDTGRRGYQGYLKHQYIRNYVASDSSRILFDYNDILCHDENGEVFTKKWKGHTYPAITPGNLGEGSIGHISPEGAIRLAKAQWWMLARIAGWDGK